MAAPSFTLLTPASLAQHISAAQRVIDDGPAVLNHIKNLRDTAATRATQEHAASQRLEQDMQEKRSVLARLEKEQQKAIAAKKTEEQKAAHYGARIPQEEAMVKDQEARVQDLGNLETNQALLAKLSSMRFALLGSAKRSAEMAGMGAPTGPAAKKSGPTPASGQRAPSAQGGGPDPGPGPNPDITNKHPILPRVSGPVLSSGTPKDQDDDEEEPPSVPGRSVRGGTAKRGGR
ncbi:hypothetical protein LTR56_020124 [Elasticomyces elasticus]|nr:hypothetical protein LTR56_020124 [Elasticomyces elasticus]KAK3633586.1 hypothetical protein LTR22_020022 [Elasticomyces elasticus]KAK5760433.1 hypothetical protein LTS12_009477 [Elasticomyces elasticus]